MIRMKRARKSVTSFVVACFGTGNETEAFDRPRRLMKYDEMKSFRFQVRLDESFRIRFFFIGPDLAHGTL